MLAKLKRVFQRDIFLKQLFPFHTGKLFYFLIFQITANYKSFAMNHYFLAQMNGVEHQDSIRCEQEGLIDILDPNPCQEKTRIRVIGVIHAQLKLSNHWLNPEFSLTCISS